MSTNTWIGFVTLAVALQVTGCHALPEFFGGKPVDSTSSGQAQQVSSQTVTYDEANRGNKTPVVPNDVLSIEVDLSEMRASRDDDPWSLVAFFTAAGMSHREEETAIQEHTAVCMKAAGWRYEVVGGTFERDIVTIGQLKAFRAVYGYGRFSGKSPLKRNANGAYFAGLSKRRQQDYLEALWGPARGRDEAEPPRIPGVNESGCRPSAERAVRTAMPRYNREVRDYLAANSASRHPAVLDREAKWVECMHEGGIMVDSFGDHTEMIQSFERNDPENALQLELKTAAVDVRCYVGILHPVQQMVEAEVLRAAARRFPEYTHAIDRVLATLPGITE